MARVRAVVCLLLVAAPLVAQDAAPPQPDRAPIDAVVETWMRFVQGGEHRGFTHERISLATARLYRYEYLYEGDLDLMAEADAAGEPQIVRWTWHLTAQLTDNFNPHRLDMTATIGGAQWTIEARTTDDTHEVRVQVPPTADSPQGEAHRLQIPADQPVAVVDALMCFRLRQAGLLARPTERLTHRLLGSGATAAEAALKVEAPVLKKYMKQDRPSYVTPVTIENARGDSLVPVRPRVFVDKYGRIVEAVGHEEGSSYVICSGATEARGDEFALSARGRRDPFSKRGAMTPRTAVNRPPTRIEEQNPSFPPERAAEELVRAGKLIDDLEAAVRASRPTAEGIYQRFLRLYQALRPLFPGDPVRMNQIDGYKARAEQLWGGAERLVKRARALLEAIEDQYNAMDEKGVEESLKQLREMRLRREFYEDERAAEMERMIRTAAQKLVQTKARVELSAKVLVLTGTVLQSDVVRDEARVEIGIFGVRVDVVSPVNVVREVACAVVNDVLYREGEEVANQGVIIEKIQRHGVRVSYKGEVREVGLKKR